METALTGGGLELCEAADEHAAMCAPAAAISAQGMRSDD
jgi:hypothetical protein